MRAWRSTLGTERRVRSRSTTCTECSKLAHYRRHRQMGARLQSEGGSRGIRVKNFTEAQRASGRCPLNLKRRGLDKTGEKRVKWARSGQKLLHKWVGAVMVVVTPPADMTSSSIWLSWMVIESYKKGSDTANYVRALSRDDPELDGEAITQAYCHKSVENACPLESLWGYIMSVEQCWRLTRESESD